MAAPTRERSSPSTMRFCTCGGYRITVDALVGDGRCYGNAVPYNPRLGTSFVAHHRGPERAAGIEWATTNIDAESNRYDHAPSAGKRFLAVLSRLVSLLLVLAFLAGSECFSKASPDWSVVGNIPVGSRARVVFQDNPTVSRKTRRVKGNLRASDAMSLTLEASPSRSMAIGRESIVKVFVRRPLHRRIPGWIALAASAIAVQSFVNWVEDSGTQGVVGSHLLFTATTTVSFFWGSRWGKVYQRPKGDGP